MHVAPVCRLPSSGAPMALPQPAEDRVFAMHPAREGSGRRQPAALCPSMLWTPLFSGRVFMMLLCSLLKTGGCHSRHSLLETECMSHSR